MNLQARDCAAHSFIEFLLAEWQRSFESQVQLQDPRVAQIVPLLTSAQRRKFAQRRRQLSPSAAGAHAELNLPLRFVRRLPELLRRHPRSVVKL